MIISISETPVATIIHMVEGEETHMMRALHGNVMINLVPILGRLSPEKPAFLCLSECDNEQELAMALAEYAESGGNPAHAPQHVFDFTGTGKGATHSGGSVDSAEITGICCRCKQGKTLIKGLPMKICVPCAAIDIGLSMEAKNVGRESSKKQQRRSGEPGARRGTSAD